MANYCKEESESGLNMDTTRTKTENHMHTFLFCYGTRRCTVTCKEPMTIQESLQTNSLFRAIWKMNQKRGNKEVVILRKNPKASVAPEFPCCLLDDNELLDIKFIRSGGNSGTVKAQKLAIGSAEHLVSFYVKTTGGENIRKVMKNKELKRIMDYVCVCAVKGEKVKVALKRDGRFNCVIFRKGALYEEETESTVPLSNLVDHSGGKRFQVTVLPHQTGSQESSQESSQEFETAKAEKSEVPETPQTTNTNQDSTNTQEKKAETPLEEKKSGKHPGTKVIPNTQEILNLLRTQHGDLLKIMKERENLKNNVDVKRFFREEYDKSAHSFTEVKRVKRLMELSDSVCQIRSDGSARGTGFLFFNRFVLTNAHVVGDLVLYSRRMKLKLTAVFGFEDLKSGYEIPLEENVVAFFKDKDGIGNHLDFALLELSSDVKPDLPELLKCYSAPPTRGGVCIIGHPEGGVKRMDPCFIIANEDREQVAESHVRMNSNVCLVVTQRCLAEDSVIRKSQILYTSCFFHGSSGSPVFDDHCNLIGVHTGGYVYEGEGKKRRSVMEYALPIFPILLQIYTQCMRSNRSDVVHYLEAQNNLKHVLQVANEQLQTNQEI